MKLYTKRGDDGGTDLFAGGRTTKTDPRICAIGDVDETNASLGLAVAACDSPVFGDMKNLLTQLQCRLFDLGADLATPDPDRPRRITQAHINELEKQIDAASDAVPPMKHFILPGGCELAARLHLARTVCRRAERACVALMATDAENTPAVIYLNRLSDLLFALARLANQHADVPDVPWKSGRETNTD
ncbi:MAG: cob(I)yrinic acid a,c-diamide adenosyltransferase [Phycisphaerales bacterium]